MINVKLTDRYVKEVDEYGVQDSIEKQASKKKATSKKLLTTFISDSTDSFRLEGDEFVINVTAPRNDSEVIDKDALYKLLKREKFFELAKFSIEDLRAWLKPNQLEKVIGPKTGPRMWKAQRKCCEDE